MSKKISGRQKSEAKRRITIANPSICYYCKASGLISNEKHCPHCGFPQFGSQADMKRFIWNINNKQQLLSEYIKAIDKAQFILLGISLISLLTAIIYIIYRDKMPASVLLGGSVIFLFLWSLSKTKPYLAIFLGFVVYMIVIITLGIMEPDQISQGFYIKAIIAVALFYGYNSAKKGQALLSELEYIAKAKGLNFVLDEPLEEEGSKEPFNM